ILSGGPINMAPEAPGGPPGTAVGTRIRSSGTAGSATAGGATAVATARPELRTLVRGHWPVATDSAKLFRARSVALLSQSVPYRQPLTFGGANSACPIFESGSITSPSGTRPGTTARTTPRVYSTGHFTRLR